MVRSLESNLRFETCLVIPSYSQNVKIKYYVKVQLRVSGDGCDLMNISDLKLGLNLTNTAGAAGCWVSDVSSVSPPVYVTLTFSPVLS